ncbi:hypothetical protein CYLTODRAFT_384952, partial [Cylindrobasidium torrendii FP15055 ss-10]
RPSNFALLSPVPSSLARIVALRVAVPSRWLWRRSRLGRHARRSRTYVVSSVRREWFAFGSRTTRRWRDHWSSSH